MILDIILTSLFVGGIGTLIAITIVNGYQMIRDPNLHFFPSVTRCLLCNHRVFVWQRHERRSTKIDLVNPDGIACACSGSSIVHKSCKGIPTSSVSVRLGQ